MFKPGDILYFKTARKSTKRSAQEGTFNGFGFGIFLGRVPNFGMEPPLPLLLRLIGSIGYLSFDDVGEFLGAEAGAECVKKFEAKYYSPDKAQQALPLDGLAKFPAQGIEIGYVCPKCKQAQKLTITRMDHQAGFKKMACHKCGFENEIRMKETVETTSKDIEVKNPSPLHLPPAPKLVGPDGKTIAVVERES